MALDRTFEESDAAPVILLVPLNWGPRAFVAPRAAQLLGPVGHSTTVEDVVRRLGAVPGQSEGAAKIALTRRLQSEKGEVARELAEGRIISRSPSAAPRPVICHDKWHCSAKLNGIMRLEHNVLISTDARRGHGRVY